MPSGNGRASAAGFTLIELMVTAAVLAILAVVAMPNLLSVINANRLQAQSDELFATLQMARGEAIRRNAVVNVCRTTDGSTCAGDGAWDRWLVLDTQPRAGGEADGVIAQGVAKQPIEISASTASISFRPSGMAVAQSTLTACVPTDSVAENQRELTVLVGGGVSSRKFDGGGTCP